ncbi:MAG: hypothetical protein V4629_09455 [Pseudomonadota bacterium]
MFNLVPASQKILDHTFLFLLENIPIEQLFNLITPLKNIKCIQEHSEAYFCYLRSLREPSDNTDLLNCITHQPLSFEDKKDNNQIIHHISSKSISPKIPLYSKLPCSSRMLLRSQSIAKLYPTEYNNTEESIEMSLIHHFKNNELPDVLEIAKKIGNLFDIGEAICPRSKSVSDLSSMYLKVSPNKIEYFYTQLDSLQQLAVFLSTKIYNEKLIHPLQHVRNDIKNKELISLFLPCWNTVTNFLRNGINDQKKIQIINTLGLPLMAGMLFLVAENLNNKINCSTLRQWYDYHIIDLIAFDYETYGDSIDSNLKLKVIDFQLQILEALEEKFKTEANQKLNDLKPYSLRAKSITGLDETISGMNYWDIVQFEEKITIAEKLSPVPHVLDLNGNLKEEYKNIRKNLESEISLDPLSSLHAWFNHLNNLLKIE